MPELCGYVRDWCPGLQKIGGKDVAQVVQTEPGPHRACHSESASVSLTVRSTVRVLPVLVSFTCPAETARSMRRVRAAASKSCHLSARPSLGRRPGSAIWPAASVPLTALGGQARPDAGAAVLPKAVRAVAAAACWVVQARALSGTAAA